MKKLHALAAAAVLTAALGTVQAQTVRPEVGKPLLYPNDPNVVALAGDVRPPSLQLPFADLNDIEAIADLVDELARPYPS